MARGRSGGGGWQFYSDPLFPVQCSNADVLFQGRSSRGYSRNGGFSRGGVSRFWHSHEDPDDAYERHIKSLPLESRCELFSKIYAKAVAISGEQHRSAVVSKKRLEGCDEKYFDVALVNSKRKDAHRALPTEAEIDDFLKGSPLHVRCETWETVVIENIRRVYGDGVASKARQRVKKRLPECYPKA